MSRQYQRSLKVNCPECNTSQVYTPGSIQKRRRKYCVSCQSKFTINRSIIQSTPPLISTGTDSSRVREEKKTQNAKFDLSCLFDFINSMEGDSIVKESITDLIRKWSEGLSKHPIFSKKVTKGVGGWGGSKGLIDSQNDPSGEHSSKEGGNDEIEGRTISNNGQDGHDIQDQVQNFKPQRGEFESKESRRARTKGGMTIGLNSGHSSNDPGHAKDQGPPGPRKEPNSNDNNDKNGIYVVHTPLEFIHLQFNDEVGRIHDHKLAKYENLSPRRFGITQSLANELRPEMEKPHWKDPAQQYRKKIPGEFVLILTKDNTCVLYPRHPFADQEFFKWAQKHLKKRHMKNLAYYYTRAESQQTNEFYTPRIPALIDEDPVNFTIKVNLDNPDQRFFVRRDQSKGDEIEYWGPTRQGGDWIYRYLSPAIEHAIGIQTYDKLKDFGGRFLNLDGYLRNQFPKVLQELDQNGEVLHQITVKQRNQRILQDQFKDYFEKSLLQGEQHSDLLSDFLRGQENQTIELDKTIRELITVIKDQKPEEKELIITDSMLDKSRFLKERLLDIILNNPGLTRREIHENFKIKRGSVNGTVYRLIKSNKIYERQNRLYSLGRLVAIPGLK